MILQDRPQDFVDYSGLRGAHRIAGLRAWAIELEVVSEMSSISLTWIQTEKKIVNRENDAHPLDL